MINPNMFQLPIAATTEVKAPWTSDRYGFVSTAKVLDILQSQGWEIRKAHQTKARDPKLTQFKKHSIDLVNPAIIIGDSVPMIRVINAHDRSAAFTFIGGVFRLACENGLLIGDVFLETFKVYHTGQDLQDRVLKIVAQVTASVPKMVDAVNAMRAIELDSPSIHNAFIAEIKQTLLDVTGREYKDLNEHEARRDADAGSSLWLTFNRIQENVLTGSARVESTKVDGTRRVIKARSIKAIDTNSKVNRALFDCALRFVNYIQPNRLELIQVDTTERQA